MDLKYNKSKLKKRKMNRKPEKRFPRCWEVMNCPDENKKNCWAYRLNLGLECWLLRKKIAKEFSWQNPRKCRNCKFFNMLHLKFKVSI